MENESAAYSGSTGLTPAQSDASFSKKRTKVVFLSPTEITNWSELENDQKQNLIEKNDLLQYEKLLNNKSKVAKPRGRGGVALRKRRGSRQASRGRPKKKFTDPSRPWLGSDDSDERDAGIENELDDDEYFRRLEEEKLREDREEALRKREARAKRDGFGRRAGARSSLSRGSHFVTGSSRWGPRNDYGSNDPSEPDTQSDFGEGTTVSSSFAGSRAELDDLDIPRSLYPHEEVEEEEECLMYDNGRLSPSSLDSEPASELVPEEEDVTEKIDGTKACSDQGPFLSTTADPYTLSMLSVDPIQLLCESPALFLPKSSNDLICPRHLLLDAVSVYEILIRYGRVLRLSPFKLEDFLAALVANENSTLLSEIHVALLRLFMREDESAGTLMYSADSKDSVSVTLFTLDRFTWPQLLAAYLASVQATEGAAQTAATSLSALSMAAACAAGVGGSGPTGCGGADTVLSAVMFPPNTIPLDPAYPFVSVEKRVAVLQGLTTWLLATGPVRGDILRDGFLPHEDHCRCCQQSGDMLCCDGCPAVFHLGCLYPPLSTVPSSAWLCPVCVKQQIPGVSDCLSEEERAGKVHRREPIGTDRAGRIYWHIGRRVFVEPVNYNIIEPFVPGLLDEKRDPDWITRYGADLLKSNRCHLLPHFDNDDNDLPDQSATTFRCNPSVDYAAEPPVYYYSSIDQIVELRQRLSMQWEPWLCQRLDSLMSRLTAEMKCTEILVQNGFEEFCKTQPFLHRITASASPALSRTHKNVFSVFDVECAASKSRLTSQSNSTSGDAGSRKVMCGFELRDRTPCFAGHIPSTLTSHHPTNIDGESTHALGVLVTRDRTTCVVRSQDSLLTTVPMADQANNDPSLSPPTVLSPEELLELSIFQFQWDDQLTDKSSLIAYRLSDEGSWRRWTNVYSLCLWPVPNTDLPSEQPIDAQSQPMESGCFTSQNLALTRVQHVEEKERRRLLGNKFTLSDLAVDLWNYIDPPMIYRQFTELAVWFKVPCDLDSESLMTEWCADFTQTLDVLKLTLCYIEAQIPLAFYCPAWRAVRSDWISTVACCTNIAQLAYAMTRLESAIRPLCFQRVWSSTMGHLSFERSTAAQREEDRRMRQFDRQSALQHHTMSTSSSSANVIRTKTPRPIRHTVWKYRGEDYRRLGGDGWMWLSSTRRNPVTAANSAYPPLGVLRPERRPNRGLQHGIGWGVCPEYLKNEVPVRPPTANECRGHVLHPITGIPIYLITRRLPYIIPVDELRRITEQARFWEPTVNESAADTAMEQLTTVKPPDPSDQSDVKLDANCSLAVKQELPSGHVQLNCGTKILDDPPVLPVSYCLQERLHFPPAIHRPQLPHTAVASRRLRFRLDGLLELRRAAAEADKRGALSAQTTVLKLETELRDLEAERVRLVERLSQLNSDAQQAREAKKEAIKAKTTAAHTPRPSPGSYFNNRALIQHSVVASDRGSHFRILQSKTPLRPPTYPRRGRPPRRKQSDDEDDNMDSDDGGGRSSPTPIRRTSRRQRAVRQDPDFVVNFDDDDEEDEDEDEEANRRNSAGVGSADDSDSSYASFGARRIPQYDGVGDESDENAMVVSAAKTIHLAPSLPRSDPSLHRTVVQLQPQMDSAAGPRIFRVIRPMDNTRSGKPVTLSMLPSVANPDNPTATNNGLGGTVVLNTGDDENVATSNTHTSPPNSLTESSALSLPSDEIHIIVTPTAKSDPKPSTLAPNNVAPSVPSSTHGSRVPGLLLTSASTAQPDPTLVPVASTAVTINRVPSGAPVSVSGSNPVRLILSSAPDPHNPNSMVLFTTSVQADGSTVGALPNPDVGTKSVAYQPAILRRTLSTVQAGQTLPTDFKLITIPTSQSIASAIAMSTARQIARGEVDLSSRPNSGQSFNAVGRRSLAKASLIQTGRLIEDRAAVPRMPNQLVPIVPRGVPPTGAYIHPVSIEAQRALDRAVVDATANVKAIETQMLSVKTKLSELDKQLASVNRKLAQQKAIKSRGVLSTAHPYTLVCHPDRLSSVGSEHELALPSRLPFVNSYQWPLTECAADDPSPVVCSLFRWHPNNLRSVILAAGRRDLPGYDAEKKRLAQITWPYPSAKPTLSECWRFRVNQIRVSSSAPNTMSKPRAVDLAGLAVLMRTLWHCLRWDEMLSDAPEGEHIIDPQGQPCLRLPTNANGAYTVRKVVGIQPLDKFWQRAYYLVQLTHTRPAPVKVTRSRTGRGPGRPPRSVHNLNRSNVHQYASSPSVESSGHSPPSRTRRADTDDSDYDPVKDGGAVRSSTRRTAGRRYRRYHSVKDNDDDDEEDGGDGSGGTNTTAGTQEIRVEEVWLSEGDLHLWEIRTFMNAYLSPDFPYPSDGQLHFRDRQLPNQSLTLADLKFDAVQPVLADSKPVPMITPRHASHSGLLVTQGQHISRVPNSSATAGPPSVQRTSMQSLELPKLSEATGSSTASRIKTSRVEHPLTPSTTAAASFPTQLVDQKSLARSLAASRAAKASVAARRRKIERSQLEQAVQALRDQLLARRRLHVSLAKLMAVEESAQSGDHEATNKPSDDDVPSTAALASTSPPLRVSRPLLRGPRRRGRPPRVFNLIRPISVDTHREPSSTDEPLEERENKPLWSVTARRGTVAHRSRGRGRGRGMSRSLEPNLVSSPFGVTDSNAPVLSRKTKRPPNSPSSSRSSTPSTSPGIGDELLERILIPSSDEVRPLEHESTSTSVPARGMVRKRARRAAGSNRGQTLGRGRGRISTAAHVKREIRPPAALADLPPDSPLTTAQGLDPSTVYCVCKQPYDSTREYLGCDLCQDWFHFECVGLSPSDAPQLGDSWHCPDCKRAENKASDMLYCLCRTPYEPTRVYIACDGCDEWYHIECVGMTSEDAANHSGAYICPTCTRAQAPTANPIDPRTTTEVTAIMADESTNENGLPAKTIYETRLSAKSREELVRLVDDMMAHKMSWPLVRAPDPVKFPASQSLKASRNLSKLSEALRNGAYLTLGDFSFAVNEVFADARFIYPPQSPELHCTDVMETYFIQQMKQLKSNLSD